MSAVPRMTVSEAYRRTRVELLDLAAVLGDDQAKRRVPACPDWTVKDVYAHLTVWLAMYSPVASRGSLPRRGRRARWKCGAAPHWP